MANSFSYNSLTQGGVNLIAQATAANPIEFVAVKSGTLAASSDAELSEKDLSWYDGKTGTIEAVSASGNTCRIVAKYTNSGTAQVAKSFCVTAKLASQSDAQAVVFQGKSDPDAEIVLPGADDISQIIHIAFYVDINSAEQVTATPGSAAAVEDLDRFVSLHSASSATEGEAQTVKGMKTFADGVTIPSGGALSVAGAANFVSASASTSITTVKLTVSDDSTLQRLYVTGNASFSSSIGVSGNSVLAGITLTGNIIPLDNVAIDIGDNTADKYLKSLSVKSIYTPVGATIHCAGNDGHIGSITSPWWYIRSQYFVATKGIKGLDPSTAVESSSTTCTLKFGGIVYAYVKDSVGNASWVPGDKFTLGADDGRVATVSNGSWGAGSVSLAAGTYVALTAGSSSSGTGYVKPILLQRTDAV